jgi:hypothetical protein
MGMRFGHVKSPMVSSTEPTHSQRITIIVVVSVRLDVRTSLARTSNESTSLDRGLNNDTDVTHRFAE